MPNLKFWQNQDQNQNKNLNINKAFLQTSDDVRASLIRSIATEHAATGQMLRCLAEYDTRRLYLTDGFASLYSFLTVGHGYSESAAMRRFTAARFGKRYPEVFAMIDRGDLSLTVVALAAKAFECLKKKVEVHDLLAQEILAKLKRSSKSQAEKFLAKKIQVVFGAETKPASSREIVRPLQQSNSTPATSSHKILKHERSGQDAKHLTSLDLNNIKGENFLDASEPDLTPINAYRVSVNLNAESMAKLRRAQELLNAKDLASTIAKLARLFNQRKDPVKNGNLEKEISDATQEDSKIETKTTHNQKNVNPSGIKINKETSNETDSKSANPRSRYIPAETRRRIYLQAIGQCSYIDPKSGRRCGERTHLQVDHIRPFARGGDHSLSNLQLLCRSHNLMRARADFGASFIQEKITGQQPLAAVLENRSLGR